MKKITEYIRMKQNARFYGIPFYRRSLFRMPKVIASERPLATLLEAGVRNDFIEIFVCDVYRLRKINQEISKIMDIGANSGFFSIAARIAHHQATVHAYEPNPKLKDILEANGRTFGFTPLFEAVGGHEGRVSITSGEESNLTRVHDHTDGSVKKTSIDNAIDRIGGRVDFMKIDCEGGEWEMLEEGRSWNQVSRISMEYHLFSKQKHEDIRLALEGIGFEVVDQFFDPTMDSGIAYAINKALLDRW